MSVCANVHMIKKHEKDFKNIAYLSKCPHQQNLKSPTPILLSIIITSHIRHSQIERTMSFLCIISSQHNYYTCMRPFNPANSTP